MRGSTIGGNGLVLPPAALPLTISPPTRSPAAVVVTSTPGPFCRRTVEIEPPLPLASAIVSEPSAARETVAPFVSCIEAPGASVGVRPNWVIETSPAFVIVTASFPPAVVTVADWLKVTPFAFGAVTVVET